MNFLQLCQRVASESGIASTGVTSVDNQAGILAKIVSWVKQSDIDIQLEREDWDFLYRNAIGQLQVGMNIYLPGDLGMSDLSWVKGVIVNGRAVTLDSWDAYTLQVRYQGKVNDTAETPSLITVSPENKIIVYPTPTQAVELDIDYYSSPVEMTTSTSESIIPSAYREMIVQRALMYFAENQEDTLRYNQADLRYKQWLKRLTSAQKPKTVFA